MVRIFTCNNDVDFETPIFMNDNQRKKFIKGMENIFGEIETHEIEELSIDRVAGKHPKKWKPEELIHLISGKSHEEVARILNRKSFSIRSKRGIWVLPFTTWARKNGYMKDGHIKNLKEVIIEYGKNKE